MERFTDDDDRVGELWGKLGGHDQELGPVRVDDYHYGFAFLTGEEGTWDYLAGIAVAACSEIPEGIGRTSDDDQVRLWMPGLRGNYPQKQLCFLG